MDKVSTCWNFGGKGYSRYFRFGLRKKSWNFEFGGGGIPGTSDLDLGKKVGTLDLGGYSGNFRFGLKKSWNFGMGGGIPGNMKFVLSDIFHFGGGGEF